MIWHRLGEYTGIVHWNPDLRYSAAFNVHTLTMNDVKLKTTQINGSFLLPLFHKKAVQLVLQEAGREQQSEK